MFAVVIIGPMRRSISRRYWPRNSELIAEAQQALSAAKRLVDDQIAIVRRLEQTGGCNSEAIDLLNNLQELLTARERRLTCVLSWPSQDNAA